MNWDCWFHSSVCLNKLFAEYKTRFFQLGLMGFLLTSSNNYKYKYEYKSTHDIVYLRIIQKKPSYTYTYTQISKLPLVRQVSLRGFQ